MAIRSAIRRFMSLFDDDAQSADERESSLVSLLDELAFEMTRIDDAFTGDERDAPAPSYDEVRARFVRRFPEFGLYNTPALVTSSIGSAGCIVGDSIDDLTDIYLELWEAEWFWTNGAEQEALWRLKFSYDHHWEAHLRGLQGYLHARRSEGEEA